MSPTELAHSLETVRGFGWVTCDWRPCTSEAALDLDSYVRMVLGSDPASTNESSYREVTAPEARRAVAHWMRRSLAYPPTSAFGASADAADPFFQVFAPSVRYFTNTNERGDHWSSKTAHTFDVGIVAIDGARIGLLWFSEDD